MNIFCCEDCKDFPVLFVTSFAPAEAMEMLRAFCAEATASVSSFGFGGTNGHVVLASPAEAMSDYQRAKL